MKYTLILFVLFSNLAWGQETVEREKSFTDKVDGIEYEIKFSKEGLIRKMTVVDGDIKRKFKMPKSLDKIEWREIIEGVWIDKDVAKSKPVTSFDGDKPFKVHYIGYLLNGNKFDSSFDRKKPLKMKYKDLVKGFSLGMANIEIGEFAAIKIAPELAYKDRDMGIIPPNSTLVFYIYQISDPSAPQKQ